MHILYLNPYHTGSHKATAEGYCAHSRLTITLLTLPPDGGWRWRMRGAALTFARMVHEQHIQPDLIFTTDMLDLATFRALTRDIYPPVIPAVVYFFENQLTYPLPEQRKRDLSFAWTNYTTMLAADCILFNSDFHRRWFYEELPDLPGRYHDYKELHLIDELAARSQVLPTGIDLRRLDDACLNRNKRNEWTDGETEEHCSTGTGQVAMPGAESGTSEQHIPTIIWLSRWDYDKQPQFFFDALEAVEARGGSFRLIVAGEAVDPKDETFLAAHTRWKHRIVHWGYPDSPAAYSMLLHQADIVVSTAIQETLGIGILEALYCGCIPLLPHRLVYPDLIPVAYHSDCLYNTFEELVHKLYRILLRCAELHQYDWRSIAAPYDWSLLAPRYDDMLEHMGT